MDWTTTPQDPDSFRQEFSGYPDARYRPFPGWWWSGERVTDERMLWQLERIHELGMGAICITGFAGHGPAGGSVADDPLAYTEEWFRLFRLACDKLREYGMGMYGWGPFMSGMSVDTRNLLAEHPDYRGELVHTRDGVRVRPFGYDFGSERAMEALRGPGTLNGRNLAEVEDLLGDPITAIFEDEFPSFPRWSPTFADDFRELKGYDPPIRAFDSDVGPRTPAYRWDLFDVMTRRAERAYTRPIADYAQKHNLLAGYDQMGRGGLPVLSSVYYGDPFRTMAWATAPGADQMGDARFYLSIADLTGAPRVWLEGFHSHGWGMTIDDQARLLFEWGREGANLYHPHGLYYSGRAFWWEWAPPEQGWKQPQARHYPVFAEAMGRLMMALAAGRHVPEVAVLYPLSTVWACTTGHLEWDQQAWDTEQIYYELFGRQGVPSGWDLERFIKPSVLAEAGYDRIVVDEARVDMFDVPIVVPGCVCLRTDTVLKLIDAAERGRTVVLVEPVPRWSAENGREDDGFLNLVDRLSSVAVVVASPRDALDHLPPPRVEGLKAQWRRVQDLDVVFVTGAGRVRIRGAAGRRPQRWEYRTGAVHDLPAMTDGEDLLIELDDAATIVALPPGEPSAPSAVSYREIELPEEWDCTYLEWGENRWGDYRLPANEGTPPVERRTFAHREGDDPEWILAPRTPEDVEHPTYELGFAQRMGQAQSRPRPDERVLGDGWHEVVSTYGPKAILDGARLLEYSERLGVEDVLLSTPIGLKGWVEPVKADLGEAGGSITSWAHVPRQVDTHLVVEGAGVVAVSVDGLQVIGPVEGGILSVPVSLDEGWHEIRLDIEPRLGLASGTRGYRPSISTRVAWALTEPYRREPQAVWGGRVMHPDYKGASGTRRFRRKVRLPEPAEVTVTVSASGPVQSDVPGDLPAGEHVLEFLVGETLAPGGFACEVVLTMASGSVTVTTDPRWETSAPGEEWTGAMSISMTGALGWGKAETGFGEIRRRSPFLDVAWLEGEESVAGHAEDLWSDSPDDPPPSWFCFTAPPGARSMTLPIVGEVQAWIDGNPVDIARGRLPLRGGGRVAMRVQAPPGHRGAGCFTDHPVMDLGPGRIRTGISWHLQGLDCFSGVIVHRATVDAGPGGRGYIDLGEVKGSVAVRVNGSDAGVVAWAPWRLDVELRPGINEIELEVANTLGPMVGRGIPTPFGPEDQRYSGILGRPRVMLEQR